MIIHNLKISQPELQRSVINQDLFGADACLGSLLNILMLKLETSRKKNPIIAIFCLLDAIWSSGCRGRRWKTLGATGCQICTGGKLKLFADETILAMIIDRVYEVYTLQPGPDFKLCQAWF
jgi:hypothetical protein